MKRYLAGRHRKYILYGGHWVSHYATASAVLLTCLLFYLVAWLADKILA